MQKKVRKLIPKTIRKKLGRLLFSKSPVEWANFGPISHCLARTFAPDHPPVIILSLPRSGSSWVGEILGSSPASMYLREPLTQSLVSKYGKGNHPVIFEVDQNNLPNTYKTSLDYVIRGLPVFTKEIVRFPEQWTLKGRRNKRVIAKEVNPLIAKWITGHNRVRIIYLLRHPVPIVSSFKRLGWKKGDFERCFTSETLQKHLPGYKQFYDTYESTMGALQALIMKQTLEVLREHEDLKIIQYEDICQNPIEKFKELYEFAELPWNPSIQDKVQELTRPLNVNKHDFSIQRNSMYEMEKWKSQTPSEDIQKIKEAWLALEPPFYQQNW